MEKFKVGMIVWTIQIGWCKIVEFKDLNSTVFPIIVRGLEYNDKRSYTSDGKYFTEDKYPSLFIEPPKEFNTEPKSRFFKTDDKVIVWNNCNPQIIYKRYYSHMKDGYHYVFTYGSDSWSNSRNDVVFFDNCVSEEEYEIMKTTRLL